MKNFIYLLIFIYQPLFAGGSELKKFADIRSLTLQRLEWKNDVNHFDRTKFDLIKQKGGSELLLRRVQVAEVLEAGTIPLSHIKQLKYLGDTNCSVLVEMNESGHFVEIHEADLVNQHELIEAVRQSVDSQDWAEVKL